MKLEGKQQQYEKSFLLLSLVILCNGYVMVRFGNLQNKHFWLFGKLVILVIVGIWFWFLTESFGSVVAIEEKGIGYMPEKVDKTKKEETVYVISEHIKKRMGFILIPIFDLLLFCSFAI